MNETDVVFYVATSDIVWGRRGLDVVKRHFARVVVVGMPWANSKADDAACRRALDGLEFDYLVSFWSGLFLRRSDFEKARKGAINIHPAPPEHPGLAFFTAARLFRDFHGTTLHEVDAELDHGPIYCAERFAVPPRVRMMDVELVLRTGDLTLDLLERACAVLRTGARTSELAALRGDGSAQPAWGPRRFVNADEVAWLAGLTADDPVRLLSLGAEGLICNTLLKAPLDSLQGAASAGASVRS